MSVNWDESIVLGGAQLHRIDLTTWGAIARPTDDCVTEVPDESVRAKSLLDWAEGFDPTPTGGTP